jgi:subfamily B ATP-binding cassette protein MsbA
LDTKREIVDAPDATPLPPVRESIRLRDVRFRYETGLDDVLKGINLEVKVGQVVAFVGASGGGKTTIVNLIPRFYDVTEGSIEIDGVDIRKFTQRSLRDQMAVVTQQTFLFNDTLRANIAYGTGNATQEQIEAAAKAANAHDFITGLPEGYNTVIGEQGVKLSGGQRQRISIARAILKNAPILILDEATSALDTESEKEVQRALDNLMIGKTTFVIAHRLSTIRNADLIVTVVAGQIVETGSHDELLKKGGEYAKLYNLQFKTQEPVPAATA